MNIFVPRKKTRAIRVNLSHALGGAPIVQYRSRTCINCTASPRQSKTAYELSPSRRMVYNPAMRWAACIVISFLTAAAGFSEPAVTLCDLLKNSERYNGKEVTVRATWRYGFEWSQFYCVDCLEQGLAWLDVPADLDDASMKTLKRIPAAGIVNVTVHGIFMSEGHFGHLNGYPHQLVVQDVSDIAVISRGMKSRSKEKELETRFACGGQNPK